MNTSIGTCSRCGGRVSVPSIWFGVIPPQPTCDHCGAVARASYGPVIDMEPPRTVTRSTFVVGTGETDPVEKE